MKIENLLFLNQGDCCPTEKSDSFLFNEFNVNKMDNAIAFVNQIKSQEV